jgi:hypothetical protein
MLSRETRFTETRPVDSWSLDGVALAVVEAMKAAHAAGAPRVPEFIHVNVTPPMGALRGSVYTQVRWGTALGDEPEAADAGH